MLKLIPLLIKVGPVVWAFVKEVVFKKEDTRYFLRNKLHFVITIVLLLYTIALYTLHEGYNAQAKEAALKGKQVTQLLSVIENKKEIIIQLREEKCPDLITQELLQELADENVVEAVMKGKNQP